AKQRFTQAITCSQVVLNRVEHQDAVLSHNADNHNHPHQRDHVERRVRQAQSQQHAAQREHSSDDNGDRVRERAKLDEQNNKSERNCQHEGEYKLAEPGLLLAVKSAVFDGHPWRQLSLLSEPRLDLVNGCAKVYVLQARRYGDRLAKAVALDLGLSFVVLDIGYLI